MAERVAEAICRGAHPSRWEHRATSAPCGSCTAGADALRAKGLVVSEVEWGVYYEATSTDGFYEARGSEAEARAEVAASPTDTGLRVRGVTPWRTADEGSEA